ncbi:MAG TPA: imidazole glycerol phosphate synthase subunit HisF [Candidatus Methylacidiphilales bacterium]
MLAKRIIPCLDVHAGKVTRGQQFGRAEAGGLKEVGDPVALALRYNEQMADELVFFDITATSEGRRNILDVIERTADQCFMPLTVGGGIRAVDDMRAMLNAGADKISVNSAAVANPDLIRAGSERFGAQCIVLSIDAKRTPSGEWKVFTHGGRKETEWEAVAWAVRGVELGAGEIVLNSINADGMKTGFDIEITRRVSEAVPVPVVASGGAGKADAVLAASVFHYGEMTVPQVRDYLKAQGFPTR